MFSVGQKFSLPSCTAEVTRLEPGKRVELEFHGSQWWFPYRWWFTEAEAASLCAAPPPPRSR